MRKIAVFAWIFVFVGLSVLIGCTRLSEMLPGDEMEAPAVMIGVAVAQTGDNAEPYGLPMKRGLELAKAELNAAGANITFVFEDNLSTVEGAKAAVQKLVEKKVSAIVGVGISTHLKEAFPIAQKAGVVAFSPISSAAGLSGEIGDYVFRAGIATNILVPDGVTKTLAKVQYANAAVLYDEDDAYSTSIKDELKTALAANDVILTEEPFKTHDTDFSTQLTNINNLETQPDVLFIAALSKEMVAIMKEARGENGISDDIVLIVPDLTTGEVDLVGAGAEGAYAFAGWSSLSDTPGNQDFVMTYMDTHGFTPSPWAAQAYATLNILANAIQTAGSSDSADIRDALAKTSHLDTILGPFSFDPNGEAIYEEIESIVQEVQSGVLVDLE